MKTRDELHDCPNHDPSWALNSNFTVHSRETNDFWYLWCDRCDWFRWAA